MGKSQRINVVRGFSLVHDPEGSHYRVGQQRATLYPGGERKALAQGKETYSARLKSRARKEGSL